MGKKIVALGVAALIILLACISRVQPEGQMYLYGESHANEAMLKKELEIWGDYYHNQGMRHLFIEYPYYTAEFLNLWMQAEDDTILDAVYEDWKGSLAYNPLVKDFYKTIKQQYPKTIFHGTDVGHTYYSTGERYLAYLRENGKENSEQYRLAQENIEQGKKYYAEQDHIYRENKMAENIIREFDSLKGKSVMGIYGGSHTLLYGMDQTGMVPCMANQLREHYGELVFAENIGKLLKDAAPLQMEAITVAGKEYKAAYLGEQDIAGRLNDYTVRQFWRLENAYEDFKDAPITQDKLPFNKYPVTVKEGQVFVIDYTKADGSVVRRYYRSAGNFMKSLPTTEEFVVE